jgi:hypothetical protein
MQFTHLEGQLLLPEAQVLGRDKARKEHIDAYRRKCHKIWFVEKCEREKSQSVIEEGR